MAEPFLAQNLAANARRLVEERYSWERILAGYARYLHCFEDGKSA
jgi:glycosyltransferase involved in cell wall biosynthesis